MTLFFSVSQFRPFLLQESGQITMFIDTKIIIPSGHPSRICHSLCQIDLACLKGLRRSSYLVYHILE